MSNNVQYTFVQNEGAISFRSNVNSFGLDHVTDKDLFSFYLQFSTYSHIDTGLLPVDGSGLLSIRSAGNHMQVAYQHAPGMYYINWGTHEGDRNAVKYYVAQPYRIVIGDFINGNILGARTFYSPISITHPELPLYHVNLPNINCKGYRGNGVGWICLYHNEDISSYPFSEKLAKLLDRCSGTEAYNDANMSETDGPRFYAQNHKPQHLWDPVKWQSYSEENGYGWTLDSDIWIPVLVSSMDNQDKHYPDGEPLTFVKAILGNYKAYYHDEWIPKPVNLISRSDLQLDSNKVFTWFKQAYNSSSVNFTPSNAYENQSAVRQKLSEQLNLQLTQEEVEENAWYCEDCESSMTSEDEPNETYNSNYICAGCFENYNYCENTSKYHYCDDTLYLDQSDLYIYPDKALAGPDYKYCTKCNTGYYHNYPNYDSIIIYATTNGSVCEDCYADEPNQDNSFPEEEPF